MSPNSYYLYIFLKNGVFHALFWTWKPIQDLGHKRLTPFWKEINVNNNVYFLNIKISCLYSFFLLQKGDKGLINE
jgi:hypothetical protein